MVALQTADHRSTVVGEADAAALGAAGRAELFLAPPPCEVQETPWSQTLRQSQGERKFFKTKLKVIALKTFEMFKLELRFVEIVKSEVETWGHDRRRSKSASVRTTWATSSPPCGERRKCDSHRHCFCIRRPPCCDKSWPVIRRHMD